MNVIIVLGLIFFVSTSYAMDNEPVEMSEYTVPSRIEFSPDNSFFLAAYNDTLIIHDSKTGKPWRELEKSKVSRQKYTWSPAGRYISDQTFGDESSHFAEQLKIWNAKTGTLIHHIKTNKPSVISHDEKTFAMFQLKGEHPHKIMLELQLRNIQGGAIKLKVPLDYNEYYLNDHMTFCPDNKFFIFSLSASKPNERGNHNFQKVVAVDSGKEVADLEGYLAGFTTDGKRAVIIPPDLYSAFKVYDTKDFSCLYTIGYEKDEHWWNFLSYASVVGNRLFAFACYADRKHGVWDLADGTQLYANKDAVNASGNSVLVFPDFHNEVEYHSLESQNGILEPKKKFTAPAVFDYFLRKQTHVSTDDKYLAVPSCDYDGTLSLYQTSGNLVAKLAGISRRLLSLKFSSNNNYLVAQYDDCQNYFPHDSKPISKVWPIAQAIAAYQKKVSLQKK